MSLALLHHQSQGSGPPLLLVHGLFGSLENLGGIAKRLSTHFTVYSLDLPNHGRSPHVEAMSLESMAHSVIAWLDAMGISSCAYLGHSLGGKVGMELALLAPERISRLVVADIAPVAYAPRHQDVFAGLAAINPHVLESRQAADQQMAAHVTEAAVRSFLLKNLTKDARGYYWRMNLPAIIEAYDHLIGANREGATFNAPVLFIKGERSSYIQAAHWPEVVKRFSNASIKVIQNTEHWLHAEKPDIFSGIAHRFLTSTD